MPESFSPLRYPGGKQILARVLAHLIRLNGREGGIYIEPYAGGAGAALALLYGEYVRGIVVNDADERIFAFWDSMLNRTDNFLKLLRDTPVSVEEWKRQRQLYLKPDRCSRLRLGFATFYLNRCNRSGIIGNAGVIGGQAQSGAWKLDARFNRADLAKRVERVARYRDRIDVRNFDAADLITGIPTEPRWAGRAFVYLDPPYYVKGSQLYLNHYKPANHAAFAARLCLSDFTWVMSYDNVPQVQQLYSAYRQVSFDLSYSARSRKVGKELLIIPPHVRFPTAWADRIPDEFITCAGRIRNDMPCEVSTAIFK